VMICILILMVSTGCSKMDYDFNPWTTAVKIIKESNDDK